MSPSARARSRSCSSTATLERRAISGLVQIGAAGGGKIEAEAMSGSISITVPASCHPHVRAKSLTHKPDVTVPAGHDFEIVAKTLSGGITVRST